MGGGEEKLRVYLKENMTYFVNNQPFTKKKDDSLFLTFSKKCNSHFFSWKTLVIWINIKLLSAPFFKIFQKKAHPRPSICV